jgi:UDP-N-acetylglucosamine 2-epimerase (non-hydrolysing)
MMKILTILGTRPNFIKIAPLVKEFKKRRIKHILVHTGQHYDKEMSKLFFQQLKLPKPDINLGIGSGTFAEHVGAIIIKLERVLKKEKPDIVVVVGDVNSTFAGAFVAKQLGFPVAHVEAGLRSFDWSMPEEVNRVLTDRISDYLFTTEASANQNLRDEGIHSSQIFFVGNVMIDTLLQHRTHASKSTILRRLHLTPRNYGILTLHRPSNVDNKKTLLHTLALLDELQKKLLIVFPIHPRTKKNIRKFSLERKLNSMQNLILVEPLGYLDFLCLMDNSKIVVTDSGGIQEETTVLKVPCITLRNTTERPITLVKGTNLLVSTDKRKVLAAFYRALTIKRPKTACLPLWDGRAAQRIVTILQNRE